MARVSKNIESIIPKVKRSYSPSLLSFLVSLEVSSDCSVVASAGGGTGVVFLGSRSPHSLSSCVHDLLLHWADTRAP